MPAYLADERTVFKLVAANRGAQLQRAADLYVSADHLAQRSECDNADYGASGWLPPVMLTGARWIVRCLRDSTLCGDPGPVQDGW